MAVRNPRRSEEPVYVETERSELFPSPGLVALPPTPSPVARLARYSYGIAMLGSRSKVRWFDHRYSLLGTATPYGAVSSFSETNDPSPRSSVFTFADHHSPECSGYSKRMVEPHV